MPERGSASAALDPLLKTARRSGIFLDFDGTLSPIVVDPAQARPVAGAVEAINRLAPLFGVVAVISGRPLAFLQRHLPLEPTVRLFGLYGLQRLAHGNVVESADAKQWRAAVEDGATTAQAELPRNIQVERKGLTFVLHYRRSPEMVGIAEEWAARFSASSGLDAQRGRLSIEIGPFHGVDKGAMVAELSVGLSAACVFGDDAGDLPAFDALTRISNTTGMSAVKVAVRTSESPEDLVACADHIVDGPDDVLALLDYLGSHAERR